jgi:hypothetical protein
MKGMGDRKKNVIFFELFFLYRVTDEKPLMLYLAYFLSDLNK